MAPQGAKIDKTTQTQYISVSPIALLDPKMAFALVVSTLFKPRSGDSEVVLTQMVSDYCRLGARARGRGLQRQGIFGEQQ